MAAPHVARWSVGGRQTLGFIYRSLCTSSPVHSNKQKNKQPFPVLDGEINSTSDTYLVNKETYGQLLTKYETILSKSKTGGGEKAIHRHVVQHKKLLPMDRVQLLLDEPAEFLELSVIAGHQMEYGDVAKAGVITGIGKIQGKYCMIIANDGTVKGGTVYPITLKKQLRAQEIAEHNRLPCVYAVDSGGAFLPLQSEIFNPGGQTFYNEAIMSSLGIPQVAVVCGNCTAGGAYVPTMADEAVIIHRTGTIFLGGPPLVQAATGEVVSAEELGGATLHCSVSGCTDYFAADEHEGFSIARDIVEGFNLPSHPGPSKPPEEPLFDPGHIEGLIPHQQQELMDVRKILSCLVDGSRFHEFKQRFGQTLVTGLAYIHGFLVGVVANQGQITDTAAVKGAHFVQMCSERNIPLLFLHNTVPNPYQGSFGEVGGNTLKDHAKMLAAVSCARVPKISVVIGNSIGPDNTLMCGRSCSPNFLFTWPNAVIGMMEKSHLAEAILREKGIETGDEAQKQQILQKCEQEMSSFYLSSRLLDDGIILPRNTRQVIGQCLDITSAYVPKQQPMRSSVVRM